jgi:hypothetical protein
MSSHHSRRSMSKVSVGLVFALYAVSLAQTARPHGHSQKSEELSRPEQKLSRLFPFADSSKHIYTVSSDHVLLPSFDKEGDITEISVVPKYYLNSTHPDWNEPNTVPFLGESDYRHVLSVIEQVSPLGQMKKKDPGSSYITNDRYPAFDEYENCVIERSMRSGRGLPRTITFPVVSFYIYFFHPVSGHLDSISKPKPSDESEGVCRIRMEGKDYWVARKDCESLKTGQHISVKAAGPVNESNNESSMVDPKTGAGGPSFAARKGWGF